MKNKINFCLTAIILQLIITAGGLLAQEFKFEGYLNSGLGLVSDNNEDSKTYFKAFGVDSGQHGLRFRLNGSYINEAKNAGIRFRLQTG